jgi:hypothetical protein
LQSARVKHKLAVAPRYIISETSGLRACFADTSEYREISGPGNLGLSYYVPAVHFGIAERVEIAAGYLILPIWNCNVRVAVFDIGPPGMFQNIAGAVFAGSRGALLPWQWESYRSAWGGMVVGTHARLFQFDIELVLAPSLSYEFVHRGSDGGYEEYTVNQRCLDVSSGVLVTPAHDGVLGLSLGATYRSVIDRRSDWQSRMGVRRLHYEQGNFFVDVAVVLYPLRGSIRQE